MRAGIIGLVLDLADRSAATGGVVLDAAGATGAAGKVWDASLLVFSVRHGTATVSVTVGQSAVTVSPSPRSMQ
jgi:hypothetical protein